MSQWPSSAAAALSALLLAVLLTASCTTSASPSFSCRRSRAAFVSTWAPPSPSLLPTNRPSSGRCFVRHVAAAGGVDTRRRSRRVFASAVVAVLHSKEPVPQSSASASASSSFSLDFIPTASSSEPPGDDDHGDGPIASATIRTAKAPSCTPVPTATTTDLFNADIARTSRRSSRTSPSVASALQSESMLRQMLDLYRSSDRRARAARPNRRSFELVMDAYLNLGRSRFGVTNDGGGDTGRTCCSADKLDELHVLLERLWEDEGRPDDLRPTVDTFNAVLGACAACAGPRGGDYGRRGRRSRQRDRHDDGDGGENSGENNNNVQEVMNYAEKAEEVLRRMEDLGSVSADDEQEDELGDDDSSLGLMPDATSHALLAAAWARQQPVGPGGTSWSGYEQWEDPSSSSSSSISLGGEHAPAVAVVAGDASCSSRAEERLRILEAMCAEGGWDDDVDDDEENDDSGGQRQQQQQLPYLLADAYDDVLAAWGRSGVEGSASKAENVLRRWEALADDAEDGLGWTVDAKVWEEERKNDDDDDTHGTSSNESGHGPEYTLYHSNKEGEEEEERELRHVPSVIPTSEAYTTVILAHALSSRGTDGGSDNNFSAQKANDWLDRTLELYNAGMWGPNRPDLVAFNACITAWGNCPDSGSAERAELLLRKLESLPFEHPDDDDRYGYLRPDGVSYNAALMAWCNDVGDHREGGGRSRRRSGAEDVSEVAVRRAQALLDRMETLKASGINPDVVPNAKSYGSVIYAWTRSGLGAEAADNADELLRRMEERYARGDAECRPNTKVYSAVISAHAKSGRGPDGARRALELLRRMEDLSGSVGDARPDVVTFTTVIDAIAKARMPGGARAALELLDKVEALYEETTDRAYMPNVRTYTSVVLALASCREPGNAEEARNVLQRMNELAESTGDASLRPNSYTYNYAINCAANTLGNLDKKREAFRFALEAFRALRSSPDDKPNSFTYAFFVKACSSLLPHGNMRHDIVKRTFEECCEAGQLSDEVISRLTRCVPVDVGREMLGFPDAPYQRVRTRDLPREWSRNAMRQSRR